MENFTMTTRKVPPRTIRMEGGLKKVGAEPPVKIAAATTAIAPINPRRVAKSIRLSAAYIIWKGVRKRMHRSPDWHRILERPIIKKL